MMGCLRDGRGFDFHARFLIYFLGWRAVFPLVAYLCDGRGGAEVRLSRTFGSNGSNVRLKRLSSWQLAVGSWQLAQSFEPHAWTFSPFDGQVSGV